MKFVSINRSSLQQVGIEGALTILAAVPFIFSIETAADTPLESWRIVTAILSGFIFLLSAFYILRKPELGKLMAELAVTGSLVTILPYLATNPAAALLAAVVFISALHNLINFRIRRSLSRPSDSAERGLQRARWASFTLVCISLSAFLIAGKGSYASEIALLVAALFSQLLSILWSIRQQSNFHKIACILMNSATLYFAIFFFNQGSTWIGTLAIGISILLILPESNSLTDNRGSWWEPLITHPGRVSLLTFLLLCLVGTFLLFLPSAASNQSISLIDAAFTSVSAVCVTGLIVLDTPHDFSFIGQFFILLLIQLGGLGIMTVTTVALHAMGRRLSLKQERMMTANADTEELSLVDSLIQILKFTAAMELVGAISLSILFRQAGINTVDACWKGIFTSISAFCNAGFALQSDSLISFQSNPMILHVVAFLIICGGIAPAVNLIVPKWIIGRPIPLAPRIALVTTVVLLAGGTLVFLAFEWNGVLAGLSTLDKLHNAWFQSVTLRTAGFNSVGLENVMGSTFLIMLCMMFIGGSPGGTAGGIKTTTLGILAATFWSCAIGDEEITIQNRRILPEAVYKAVTIVAAGTFTLLSITLMLEVTQYIGARDLIFEATSALGTVGLSLGATSRLDSIGKIIIMLAMFAGRIGPVTLFTLLSKERSSNSSTYLDARINLT